jgi:formate hydrogenlyase transcriptional activator
MQAVVHRIQSAHQDGLERRFEQIIGTSPALEAVLQQVECVAPTDSTVLIEGETGTGKELIARAIHNLRLRCGRPFIKLNCAAIPFDLLESELFGHERGAFTGAIAQRTGRFELADKGTLLLDEVGDIPLGLQPKLLRVLQEQELERLGGSRTHRVDVRLVAATNQDLASMVERNQFREDLYYRLNVFPIHVPPLRERREDIRLLVEHFVRHFSQRMNKKIDTIPSEAMQVFLTYNWPGNIRELQNVIERAVILSPGPELKAQVQDLNIRVSLPQNGSHQTLQQAERTHILAILNQTNWVLSGPNGAATRLGMNRSTLQFRMKKLGIVRPSVDASPAWPSNCQRANTVPAG